MESFRFGTVGSPLSTPKKPGGSVGAVYQIANLTLNALELGWVQSVRVTEETCEKISSAAQEQNVAISVHAPYFINLNATEDEWPKSRKRLMDAAIYGAMAGATDIIFHPGSYFGQEPQAVLPLAIDRLRACAAELQTTGIGVVLRPETMGKGALLGSLRDTLAMSAAIPGVEPCLDFAHLHARTGNGTANSLQEWRAMLEEYQQALGKESLKRLHIHLSGIAYSEKGEREHLPIQESDFNLIELFTALKEYSCGGRILCESPIMEQDALYMKETWERL